MATVERRLREEFKKSIDYEALLDALLCDLTNDEAEQLLHELKHDITSRSDSGTDEAFAELLDGGQKMSAREMAALERRNIFAYFKRRKQLLSDALTPCEVAELLGVTSRQTAHDRRLAGTLLAVHDNGVWKFPIWQFDPGGANGVVDGLPEALKELHLSDFSKLSWFVSHNNALESTPIEALKSGRKAEVILAAQAVGVS